MSPQSNNSDNNHESSIGTKEPTTISNSLPQSPILWQNTDKTVTVIDVPHSIACAQGTTANLHLLSSFVLQSPFPSHNEPKSAAARAKLEGTAAERGRDEVVRDAIERAMEEVRRGYDGEEWCLPRPFVQEREPRCKKRRRGQEGEEGVGSSSSVRWENGNGSQHQGGLGFANGDAVSGHQQQLIQPRNHDSNTPAIDSNTTTFFSNTKNHTISLTLPTTPPNSNATTPFPSSTYLIPPNSTFILGDCSKPPPLHNAPKINLILLDPPWPNRSQKRTHLTPTSSATYSTPYTVPATRELLLSTDLPTLMADDCLVGVWITNKPAVRESVLHPLHGVFTHWGVELVEEWVWVKTISKGETVTPLEGLWRKPWEILLLGRRRRHDVEAVSSPSVVGGEEAAREEIKRRVIFGVPDLHSRKPCLKTLLEPLVRASQSGGEEEERYAALEVFARHLVAGWWSWGNECVKFNWEGFWRDGSEGDDLDGV